jgi:hypothetical protein
LRFALTWGRIEHQEKIPPPLAQGENIFHREGIFFTLTHDLRLRREAFCNEIAILIPYFYAII